MYLLWQSGLLAGCCGCLLSLADQETDEGQEQGQNGIRKLVAYFEPCSSGKRIEPNPQITIPARGHKKRRNFKA
nr:hypothetical protein [uncultured Cohaesibacter sp.]